MAKKPTYKELEKQIKELHNEVILVREHNKEIQEKFNLSKIILSATPDLLALKDCDLVYQAVNPAFCKFLGKTEESIIGKTDFDLFPRFEAEMYRRDDLKVIKTGKAQIQDEEVTGEDEKRWLRVAKTPLLSEKGATIGVLCSVVDITNRKRAEESLVKAEHEKNSILDSLFEHVIYMDLKMRILWANTAACKSLNLTRDEVIGRHCFKLWAGGSKPCSDCAVVEAMKTGQVQEVQKTTPDGRSWFNIGCPVKDDKNTITGGVEVSLDITELKKAEVFLRESEERYRSLAENSLVGIWQITLDGYTIYINPAMCRMLEIENPEVLNGKTYEFFGDDENLEIVKRELTKRKKGISSTYEVEIIGEKGTKRNVMISAAPIFLSEDKVHSTIGTFTDITDRKNAEKALIKAHNELEQRVKNRTKELETKKNSLEELNTAMKVLLKKREEDKIDIEKNVMTNVKELVWPYFEKIKKTKLDDQQRALLSITESNINEIVSPFTRTMSLKYLNLTPTEIRIANLIRHGSSTKKIAEIMNASPRTVETHRKNIRRKIGLEGKRANLRSHLLSLH
ncbi:MAG: PAS domain-containing protein [Desulfobacterales bacterium]|jgi:PAS domain S-box-containing protein